MDKLYDGLHGARNGGAITEINARVPNHTHERWKTKSVRNRYGEVN